jgi:hypothetical protein
MGQAVSGGPGSIPGQSMWDLWWTKWHGDRFFPEYFDFSPVSFIPQVLYYVGKVKKLIIFLFIFITSVAFAQKCLQDMKRNKRRYWGWKLV